MKKYIPFFVMLFFSLNFVFAEKIHFSASKMTGKAGNEASTTVLSGNAYIKTETMEIHAEEVELSGKDFRYIKATGYVEGKNLEDKTDFSCDELEYDREEQKAILKGNVIFSDLENDVEAEAEMIEYNQKSGVAILQINMVLKQEDNTCTGSYGIYYKDEQLLELSGNAQIMQNEDTFRAQHITLNLDTQEISLGGNVKGTVTDTKKADKTEQTNQTEENNKVENSENSETNENTENIDNADNVKQSEDNAATEKNKNPVEKTTDKESDKISVESSDKNIKDNVTAAKEVSEEAAIIKNDDSDDDIIKNDNNGDKSDKNKSQQPKYNNVIIDDTKKKKRK